MWNDEYSGLIVLVAALVFDFAFGEPPERVHPVVWMGRLVAWLEGFAPRTGLGKQLAFGVLVATAVPTLFTVGTALLLSALRPWLPLYVLFSAYLLTASFSVRALGTEAWKVRTALENEDIFEARRALRSLCSRDAAELDRPQLVAATVESVAENSSDSFVAPLFYFVLFGVPGAVLYRTVNTLDAMIGYHGRYEHLGKASARLDDALNYVPARLSAGSLLLAAFLAGKDWWAGWRILRRDAAQTESPNAGRPMAAMAGLLNVQLSKQGCYHLGDPQRELRIETIDEAWRVVLIVALLTSLLVATIVGVSYAAI